MTTDILNARQKGKILEKNIKEDSKQNVQNQMIIKII